MYHAQYNPMNMNQTRTMGFTNRVNKQTLPIVIGGLVLAYTALETNNPRNNKTLKQSDGYQLLAPIFVGYTVATAIAGRGF